MTKGIIGSRKTLNVNEWSKINRGLEGATEVIWNNMTQDQRKKYLNDIGFNDYYSDTNFYNIPYSIRSIIDYGIDIGNDIDKNWNQYTFNSKSTLLDEVYHGSLSSSIVRELANMTWDRIPETNKKEIISYMKIGRL